MKLERKTLLILIDWFVPGYMAGGPIQSSFNMVIALRQKFSIKVITSDTDHLEIEPMKGIVSDSWNTDIIPGVEIFYMSKSGRNSSNLASLITQVDPDFIHLNHMFSPLFVIAPLFMKWKGKIDAKIIVCPRGALYKSALKFKSYKKYPFLAAFRIMGIHRLIRFHATNENEKTAILQYFPKSEVYIADNLPKLDQSTFKERIKEQGSIDLIYVARVHPLKNLFFFLEILKQAKAYVKFTIIGPIEDMDYWQKCEQLIATFPSNIEVIFKGAIPNHEISAICNAHHLFVLPTMGENFGHSIFESFLAGRPVLISDQTPWVSLKQKGIGWDINLENKNAWLDALEESASWDNDAFNIHARRAWNFARFFINQPKIIESYITMFQ